MLSMENGHWKNTTFDAFPVDVTSTKRDEDKLLYDDYEKVKKILKSLLREIHEYADIRKDIGSCEHCTSYGFTSKTEKQTNMAVFPEKSRLFNTI